MKVIHLREHPEYLQEAIAYFQSKWASPASMKVYEDSLTHSFADTDLPQWFLLVDNQAAAVPSIIGCGGLITNDFISRMDLMPWLCAPLCRSSLSQTRWCSAFDRYYQAICRYCWFLDPLFMYRSCFVL